MPSYLVEVFVSEADATDRVARDRATRRAAAASTRAGTPIKFGRSIYVPGDEICLFSVDALSVDDVERVAQRAGLRLLRVVEALPREARR